MRNLKKHFQDARWDALQASGAHVQRPLWASTSTKNPDYPELLYVESLVGPHTVNTMPPATLEALVAHGDIHRTIDDDVESAQEAMAQLAATGISIAQVTDDLEAEGVKKFADAYEELLSAIEARRKELA